MYSINFTVTKKILCLSLNYNGANSYLFVNGKEIVKFKAEDTEIVAGPLCLGNISKHWSTENMKKTRLNGYVYEFNVDYDNHNTTNYTKAIPFIHNYYLMLKYGIKLMFRFAKKVFFIGLTILSDFTNVNSLLNCISMKNQECKVISN